MRTCKVCGKPLKQKKAEPVWRFNRRVTCGKGTRCQIMAGKIAAARPGSSMALPASMGTCHRISDDEQAALNLKLHRLDCEHRGLAFDPGRVLSQQETLSLILNGQITPIKEVRSNLTEVAYFWR